MIDDYALRMVEQAGRGLSNIKQVKEKVLPEGLIEHGRIINEIEFYHFMKETVLEWGIKRRPVQFFAPDSLVIMRKEIVPTHVKDNEIKEYFNLEFGHSIYLPFENPAFDVYILPKNEATSEQREALLFAVPLEELKKYSEVFIDVGLKPNVCDIRSLAVYRYFYSIEQVRPAEVYLFFEFNLQSVAITIFSDHQPEFLRFQALEIQLKDWVGHQVSEQEISWKYVGGESYLNGIIEDQMIELDRIMNFYRYSIHKGRKMVTHIVLYGDSPKLDQVYQTIKKHFQLPVTILNGYTSPEKMTNIPRSFIPLLGLSLKGEFQ